MRFFKIRPSEKPSDPFFLEVRPILILFKTFARLIYDSKDGRLTSYPRFLSMLIWFIMYGAQSVVTMDLALGLVRHLRKEESFLTSIVTVVSLVFVTLHFFLPVSVILESKKICSYINRWADLQVQFFRATGTTFTPKYSKILRIFLIIIPLHTALGLWIEASMLYFERWYHLVLYFSIYFVCQLNILFWAFCLLETEYVASLIKDRINKKMESLGGHRRIAALRNLWISVVELCEELGGALSRTLIVLTIINLASGVTSVYAVITYFISGRSGTVLFVFLLSWNGMTILSVVEPAHRAMSKVGHDIYFALIGIDTMQLDRATFIEVDKFLQVVKGLNPQMTLGGFFVVDRSLLTSIVGATVTYLIVLIQFKAPSENT